MLIFRIYDEGIPKNSAIMKNVLTLISSSWYASNIFGNTSYWTRIETNKCWKENFHLCDEILCLHLSYWYANVHYLCRLNGAQVLQEVCQVVMKAFIETKFHWKLLDVKLLSLNHEYITINKKNYAIQKSIDFYLCAYDNLVQLYIYHAFNIYIITNWEKEYQ